MHLIAFAVALTVVVVGVQTTSVSDVRQRASPMQSRFSSRVALRPNQPSQRPQIVRTGTKLPTDPWQLFNITVRQNGNKTEGRNDRRSMRARSVVSELYARVT